MNNIIAMPEHVSFREAVGSEEWFTNKELTSYEKFAYILKCTGKFGDNIEFDSLDSQVKTSDGKEIDNVAILSDGTYIVFECQDTTGVSDMAHTSKLFWYASAMKNQHELESVTVILAAESFTQEALNFAADMEDLSWVESIIFIELDFFRVKGTEEIQFVPRMQYPTKTTNQLKQFKAKATHTRRNRPITDLYTKHDELLRIFLEEQNVKAVFKQQSSGMDVIMHINGFKVVIWHSNTGSLSLRAGGNHENEDIFKNNKNYFILNENNLSKSFEEFKIAWKLFTENL